MRIPVLATVAVLLLAGPALADGPVVTAGGDGSAAPPQAAPPAPLPTTEAWSDPGQPIAMGPCGPEKVRPDSKLDTALHGELEAGIGTGGYRHLAGSVCQPIGQNGAVAVGVSTTQFNQGYRRR